MTDCQFGPIDDRLERIEKTLAELVAYTAPPAVVEPLLGILKQRGSG